MIYTTTPARYKHASLKCGQQNDITHLVAAMFTNEARKTGKDRGCLLIVGVPGCGKTYAIWGLKNDMDALPEFIEKEIEDEYHSYVNASKRIISVIDASWFTEYAFLPIEEKHSEMVQIKTADVLAIDDLGMEAPGERNAALIESIINSRYNAERATIITSNLDMDNLKLRYSERIIDRLREWGQYYECPRHSERKKSHLKAVG